MSDTSDAPRVPGGNPADPFPIVNDALNVLKHQETYANDPTESQLLTFHYLGGRWGGFSITKDDVALTDNAENYIVVARATGALSVATATTNWNDLDNYARVYHITTLAGVRTALRDYRGGPGGVHGGGSGGSGASTAIPQNSQSTAYTLVLGDAGKHILHPSADTTARVFTIPANSSVAFPVGTVVTFVNQNAAGAITIAITTDTMRLAGAGTTGSRTLAANGIATALKLTSTEWIISGTGLT
ncbi:MAG: hypothetical protein Q8S12_00320 [Hydrogenophaga sp.]|uniref:hypothetical protein n=1 Tax=Hydrogenophaga sp. TaxID=1904254 RepID=UPI002736BE85|nr:hypothetical protein [Hydrogenophaga sp.]MDP3625010.1 hypothetical protein [Hydrogenophaga sp.]